MDITEIITHMGTAGATATPDTNSGVRAVTAATAASAALAPADGTAAAAGAT